MSCSCFPKLSQMTKSLHKKNMPIHTNVSFKSPAVSQITIPPILSHTMPSRMPGYAIICHNAGIITPHALVRDKQLIKHKYFLDQVRLRQKYYTSKVCKSLECELINIVHIYILILAESCSISIAIILIRVSSQCQTMQHFTWYSLEQQIFPK